MDYPIKLGNEGALEIIFTLISRLDRGLYVWMLNYKTEPFDTIFISSSLPSVTRQSMW